LTYAAPGAIIVLPCPLQAFGLHDSNCAILAEAKITVRLADVWPDVKQVLD
jgi:hypothetical protein